MMINPFYITDHVKKRNPEPKKVYSGNTKKCKSCKHFELNSMQPCYNRKFVKPTSNACDKYERRKK